MIESDKQLMREGRQLEALGDNYIVRGISASIWLDGAEAYRKRIDTNVIRTGNYSNKYSLYEEELNEILKEYPKAYYVVNDSNCWL